MKQTLKNQMDWAISEAVILKLLFTWIGATK